MINIKVKRISKDAVIPSYAHENDSGMDLFSIETKKIASHNSALIKTGIIIELPKCTEAQIRPRSGLALKHQITVLNSPGTIDSGFRGEIGVILINHGKKTFEVEKGMKIAQIVIKEVKKVSVIEVDDLTNSSRGEKGFGSSGY